ncbi:sugar ABC transporter ATP-binding protein [Cytophaga sp. FL35]|uniref:sugar ABC transporter ATP-binding protein n=1 Tax=Cytophaga sp. FL35 TaxID=1904456 RepID=UPI001653DA71|nr:sugar ABC transporter ATP-binding protein [Cytophaga sp. FL35]MBC6998041.1 sugar ABC transporter ATP-binding protein [Cytophaga sp. FL35]
MLEAKNITKRFTGITALNEVQLHLKAGRVTGIIGENGAGKSTLMKILSGVHTDYEGELMINGKTVKFKNTRDAQDKGIAIIHQELNLFPYLSVTENIFLGRELKNKLGILDDTQMKRKAKELLAKVKLEVDPKTKVENLKVGEQQLLEIAKALLLDTKVLIMDEPTSAITDTEANILFGIIEELKKEGTAIAYISHKMNEIFTICDDYVVLRDGEFIGEGPITEVSENELIQMMAGREVKLHRHNTHIPKNTNANLLEVDNLKIPRYDTPEGISFALKKGEILGVFGLMGAGRTELLETLFGLHPKAVMGNLIIDGQKQRFNSPQKAIKAGLALVTEDRKRDGIVPDLNVRKNISITVLEQLCKLGVLQENKEKTVSKKYIDELKIKTESDQQLIKTLSGGNQQKVILGKWLGTNPKVLLLDEPTRGIDVNAKSEIHKLINELAAQGMGVIMVSSELPEILAVSHRILVLSEGRLTGNFSIDKANDKNILKAAIA